MYDCGIFSSQDWKNESNVYVPKLLHSAQRTHDLGLKTSRKFLLHLCLETTKHQKTKHVMCIVQRLTIDLYITRAELKCVGEFRFCLLIKDSRIQKIQDGPEFQKIVLKWCTCVRACVCSSVKRENINRITFSYLITSISIISLEH